MNQRIEVTFDVTINEGLFRFSFPYGAGADYILEALQKFSDLVAEQKANLIRQKEAQAQESAKDSTE